MYHGSIHSAHVHADERRKDMLAEAQRARRANLAAGANRSVSIASNLRHRIGVALVAAGSRLQHPVADQPAQLGSLRAAR